MSNQEGFLSSALADIVARIRRDFSKSFDVLETLNRLALEVLPRLQPNTDDNQKLLEAALYGRALQSIQATALLAERGMTGDARTVLRSCVETAILQRKVADDATFADKLIERHDYHRRALGNALLQDQQAIADVQPEEIRKLEAAVDEISARYPNRKPGDINLSDVAASVGGKVLYDCFFRPLSGDAAHATLDALIRHVRTDKNGDITGLRFGPQLDDLADTLSRTISVLLFVLDAAIESFSLTEFRPRLAASLESWRNLLGVSQAGPADPASRR